MMAEEADAVLNIVFGGCGVMLALWASMATYRAPQWVRAIALSGVIALVIVSWALAHHGMLALMRRGAVR